MLALSPSTDRQPGFRIAHLHPPEAHRRRLHSTNTLKRLNKEIKRRTSVVGIFPQRDSLIRLTGMCSPSRTTSGRPGTALLHRGVDAPDRYR
jgi:transposase-like protein